MRRESSGGAGRGRIWCSGAPIKLGCVSEYQVALVVGRRAEWLGLTGVVAVQIARLVVLQRMQVGVREHIEVHVLLVCQQRGMQHLDEDIELLEASGLVRDLFNICDARSKGHAPRCLCKGRMDASRGGAHIAC